MAQNIKIRSFLDVETNLLENKLTSKYMSDIIDLFESNQPTETKKDSEPVLAEKFCYKHNIHLRGVI